MKYVSIFLILFAGCATTPPIKNFTCSILNVDGVYVTMGVGAHSEQGAEDIANIVRGRLVTKKMLPENTSVECSSGMWMPHEK